MPKISSNLEHTKAFIAADAGWYPAKVIKCAPDEKSKIPKIGIDFQILDTHPRYGSRKIMFAGFIYGGINKNTNEPYSLNGELNYIGSLGVPYSCQVCGSEQSEAPVRDKTDYRCPGCKAVLTGVDFDTESFVGKICEIELTCENKKKNETDPETGNTRLIEDLDAEGMPIKQNSVKRTRPLQQTA